MTITPDELRRKIAELVSLYHQGLYRQKETAETVIDLVDDTTIDAAWEASPTWLQTKIKSVVADIAEDSEWLFLGGGGTPEELEEAKQKLLLVKQWLIEHRLLPEKQAAEQI
jgi:hypothetical protein